MLQITFLFTFSLFDFFNFNSLKPHTLKMKNCVEVLSIWVVCVDVQLLRFFGVAAVCLAVLVALFGVVAVLVAFATDQKEGDDAGNQEGDDDADHDGDDCRAITRKVHALKKKTG